MRIDTLFEVLTRRWIVAVSLLVVMLIVTPFALAALRSTYIGTASVLLVNNDPTKPGIVPLSDLPLIVESMEVLSTVKARLHLDASVDDLRNNLNAKTSLRSSVVPITYRDGDPKQAVAIANAVADQTVTFYKALAARQYDEATAYLQRESQAQERRIVELDTLLGHAAAGNAALASTDALDTLATQLVDLQQKRAEAYATLVADRATFGANQAQSAEVARIVRNETLVNDPIVQAIRTGVATDTAKLATVKSQYTSNYPGLAGLQHQVETEDRILSASEASSLGRGPSSATYATTILAQRQAGATVAGDQARVQAIDAQIKDTRDNITQLSTGGVDANSIRAKLDATKNGYQALRLRLVTTKADQAVAASLASLVVIEHATEARPRIPALLLNVFAALAVVIVAIAGTLAWDSIASGLRAPIDIEREYGQPVISMLGKR